jgi:glutamyl/glutaminyl-tRNA synthetase
MIVTRFNPSVNGNLHLGHLYTALVNEALAVDGRFYVRFDDTAPGHLLDIGKERMAHIRRNQEDELRWLGLRVDAYYGQIDALDEVHAILKKKLDWSECDGRAMQPEIIADSHVMLFPAVPMITAEKVVFDHMIGTTLLVRGMDLMTEYALYQYFCQKLGYEEPRHIYLPRMSYSGGDMSKREGGVFISSLKADGHTPEEVRWMVAKAALREPYSGWTLLNLKGAPRL